MSKKKELLTEIRLKMPVRLVDKLKKIRSNLGAEALSNLLKESINLFSIIKSDSFFKLKHLLTEIKGSSELLLEDLSGSIDDHFERRKLFFEMVRNIYENCIEIENELINMESDSKLRKKIEVDILCIEDDIGTIKLLKNYFLRRGISFKAVVSGSQAFDLLKNIIPKIIITDIVLPDISGYDLIITLKNEHDFKNIPIYICSAIPETEIYKNTEKSKIKGVIPKPFGFADFKPILDDLVKRKSIIYENFSSPSELQ